MQAAVEQAEVQAVVEQAVVQAFAVEVYPYHSLAKLVEVQAVPAEAGLAQVP